MRTPAEELARRIAINGSLLTELIEEVAGLGPQTVEAVLRDVTDPVLGHEMSECGRDLVVRLAIAVAPEGDKE